jgi:hypothetical protein
VTLLTGCASCALALACALFVRDVATASTADARAQIAADAAALAAAAESGPYGDGAPQRAARRFAELNGARLISCDCEPGATSMLVAVEREGAAARARAVLDVALLAPAPVVWDRPGLHPTVEMAVERLVAAAAGRVWVTSAYRSSAHQEALWQRALARYGSPERADDWVAPPGHSMHERGLAVDLGGHLSLAARLVERLRLPLHRPLANEPWHFELAGARGLSGGA